MAEIYVTVRTIKKLRDFEFQTFKWVSADVAAILRMHRDRLRFKLSTMRVFETSIIVQFPQHPDDFLKTFGDTYVNGDYDLVDLILSQFKEDAIQRHIFNLQSFVCVQSEKNANINDEKTRFREPKLLTELRQKVSFYQQTSTDLAGWGNKSHQEMKHLTEALEALTGLIGVLELEQLLQTTTPYFDPEILSVIVDFFEKDTEWDIPMPIETETRIKYFSRTPPFWEKSTEVTQAQLQSLLTLEGLIPERPARNYPLKMLHSSGKQVISELLQFLDEYQLDRLYVFGHTIYSD